MILTKERLEELVPIEEKNVQISKTKKERWADPEYKERVGTKMSKAALKVWGDPEYRKRMIAKLPKARKRRWEKHKLSTIERFHKLYTVDEKTGCWNWNGGTDFDGYGKFWINHKAFRAHRWL